MDHEDRDPLVGGLTPGITGGVRLDAHAADAWLEACPRHVMGGSLPAGLFERFVSLDPDAETRTWLHDAVAHPHGRWRARLHAMLRRVASDHDVDGWLGTHPMQVLGPSSFRALLGVGASPHGTLLDVGAGCGDVTASLGACFESVVATETSRPMVRRLQARGFEAYPVDLASCPLPGPSRVFDAVSLLNVLDRCERPRSLLHRSLAYLRPEGVVLVACPLPSRPHFDVGGHTVDPDEPLDVRGETFEAAAASLVRDVLAPAGLEVVRWTRTPYLARGGPECPLHVLDDAVVVARRSEGGRVDTSTPP